MTMRTSSKNEDGFATHLSLPCTSFSSLLFTFMDTFADAKVPSSRRRKVSEQSDRHRTTQYGSITADPEPSSSADKGSSRRHSGKRRKDDNDDSEDNTDERDSNELEEEAQEDDVDDTINGGDDDKSVRRRKQKARFTEDDRTSMNSLEHEMTLKDRQEVSVREKFSARFISLLNDRYVSK